MRLSDAIGDLFRKVDTIMDLTPQDWDVATYIQIPPHVNYTSVANIDQVEQVRLSVGGGAACLVVGVEAKNQCHLDEVTLKGLRVGDFCLVIFDVWHPGNIIRISHVLAQNGLLVESINKLRRRAFETAVLAEKVANDDSVGLVRLKNEIQVYIVQSRYYADESDTEKKNVEKLRAELNAASRKLAKERRRVQAIRSSVSFQLGNILIQAVRRPGRNTILLPYRVIRLAIGLFRRRVSPSMLNMEKVLCSGDKNNIRIAVYADANMNLIDGSTVWTASVVEALAGLEYSQIFFFLKSREKRGLLTEPLKKSRNVQIISPDRNLVKESLTPEAALDRIEQIDRQLNFDAIIVRRLSVCEEALLHPRLHGRLWTYLTDIPQSSEDLTGTMLQTLDRIAGASKYILCQTQEFCSHWERYVPSAKGKVRLLPPMVPACKGRSEAPTAVRRICYAGKFAPLWGIFEMFEAFASLRAIHPEVELHIFGDKIHQPPEFPDFRRNVSSYLENTAGVVWHGGLSRVEVLAHMTDMDLGWAWRSPELENNTLELSTKILEYGRCGLPVILARNKINERLLGPGYPLFADTYDELVELLHRAASSPDILAAASAKTYAASEQFTVEKVRDKYIRPLFSDLLESRPRSGPGKRGSILVAGHDFRFINRLCQEFSERGYSIAIDKWTGHNRHDVNKSRELIEEADIIISEWCLGNAVWYSKNKRPDQKHIIRFHLQERELNYPENVDMHNVDTMIFVGPHIKREAIASFEWERWADKKLVVIPNYVDSKAFDLPKSAGAQFNIGIVGIVPQRKRLDLALDIIEKLRRQDERFQLYIKGKMPRELPWMLGRTSELKYYDDQMDRINNSALLKDAAHFDGWGDDIPQWYQKIGFILSVSDFESFHLSVTEGAASSAIPLILKWKGAEEIYPRDWSYHVVDEMVNTILDIVKSGRFEEIAESRCAYVRQNFDIEHIAQLWLKIIEREQSSVDNGRDKERSEEMIQMGREEGEKAEQSSVPVGETHKLEREISDLKNDKQELQDRIVRLRNEYAQRYDSLTTSITYRAGNALVKAATSPKGAVTLPVTLWRMYRDYRSRKSLKLQPEPSSPEKSEITLGERRVVNVNETITLTTRHPPLQEARILFMPTNGGGLGHVTRLLAVARRLKTDTRIREMVFITTSDALNVIRREGFVAYHHPPWDQLRDKIPARGWQNSFQSVFNMVINNHALNVFVFDGVSAAGVTPAIAKYDSMRKIWLRRMLLKEGKAEILDQKAEFFDLQLCAGELGQKSVKRDSAGRIIIPPMVFLNRSELLSRQDVIEQLGLSPTKKTIFVQLGAGNINDINTQSEIIIEVVRQFKGIQIVLAESPVSQDRLKQFKDIKTIRDYPLSRYYQGFDVAISATGYNTFTELICFGVPSIFIPNLETAYDDQLGRAMIAQRTGTGLILNPLTAAELTECMGKLLDDSNNAEIRKKCRSLCSVNGSDVAAQVLGDFLF